MMLKKTHIRNDERHSLELWQRKLRSLYAHGLGQVGPCTEMHDAKRVADQIEERLNPKPLPDLVAAAAAVADRFGAAPWVQEALAEAQEG
jgi:hypothetical protein